MYLRLLTLLILALAQPAFAAIELKVDDRPLYELGALILGGIGIFLIGIHFAAEHLQHMAGGRFESWVGRLTANPAGLVVFGGALGFITQSGKAVAFILADLVKARLIESRRAALVIFWGNVGCSLIALASMVSLKVLALTVLGITALGLTFHVPKRLVHTYGALFGLAMIMFGLYLVKDGAAGIASAGWVPDFIEALRGTYLLSFCAGLLLTLLIQSNLAVSMIAIALASSGLLSLAETGAVVIGAQAGTGVLTLIFSLHAKGRARQVVGYQIAFDLLATLSLGLLFILEVGLGLPLLLSLIEALTSSVGTQTVALAISYQVIAALLAAAMRKPVYEQVERFYPPLKSESLSEPEYLSESANSTPELSLLMIDKEQRRLIRRLPLYLEYARAESDRTQLVKPADYHAAFSDLSTKINQMLTEVSRRNLNPALAEVMISLTKTQEQLITLEQHAFQIAELVTRFNGDVMAARLGRNILESVDFLVLTAIDALDSDDAEDLETLASMTTDRSQLMMNLRTAYFEAESDLPTDARTFVLDMTLLVENVVKALSRYGEALARRHQSMTNNL